MQAAFQRHPAARPFGGEVKAVRAFHGRAEKAGKAGEVNNITYIPVLSRILITDEFKIQLLDFNKEVKMTPLQKALYIFYLRHPEGVEFKMLSVYYDELLSIYKVLSNREDLQKQQHSIRRLVDATDNAINEKCTRI